MSKVALAVILLGFIACNINAQVAAPPFATTMCNGVICVGFVDGAIEWWVYYASSFEEGDPSVLDDDEYLAVSPQSLFVYDQNDEFQQFINLQALSTTSDLSDFDTVYWNGAKSLSVNYTLQSTPYSVSH
jgi:hypothetical protein